MKKNFFLALLLLAFQVAVYQISTAQNALDTSEKAFIPTRTVNDMGLAGIEISYDFPGVEVMGVEEGGRIWNKLFIPGFSQLKEIGKPALPSHNDLVIVPEGATYQIDILEEEWLEIENQLIYPALKPASDRAGTPSPSFEFDEIFYDTDIQYPSSPVSIDGISQYRNNEELFVRICPVSYNPKTRHTRMLQRIRYIIRFSGSTEFVNKSENSMHFLEHFGSAGINRAGIRRELDDYCTTKSAAEKSIATDYFILTVDRYLQAAKALALWKQQLGYGVEIISQEQWTSAEVKAAIHDRYDTYLPKPDYFVILGDHPDVPGEIKSNNSGDEFATDLYYACMNSAWDYQPDMAFGRISVNSPAQSLEVVNKIINYEKRPVKDSSFYKTSVHAAFFQDYDDYNSYADRRFAQTAEELLQYMTTAQSMNAQRVYYTSSDVTPLRWNNGTYSSGEQLPAYLKKPTFAWDGDASDIVSHLNSGALYIMHRDHGDVDGWSDPSFKLGNINQLNNGDKLPIVLSINCLTGAFLETECFSEKFLRHSSGGTAGIFGHSEVSYSGYNDALSMGIMDAIWSSPGFTPNFTGSGGLPYPSVNPHNPIINLGDVKNYALNYMNQTWGISIYTHEIFHYFGDPSMRIGTAYPQEVIATHDSTILASTTNQLSIAGNVAGLLATLVVDGVLIASEYLPSNNSTMAFTPINGNNAILTISGHNYEPYVDTLPILGIPVSDFECNITSSCDGFVSFTNLSLNNADEFLWEFGDGYCSNEKNPEYRYKKNGIYSVKMTAKNAYGKDVAEKTNLLDIQMPDIPTTISAGSCDTAAFVLEASGSGELQWFDQALGGNLINTGNSYNTGSITQSVSYYVENVSPLTQHLGKLDNSGPGSWGTSQSGLFFSCYEKINLHSVKVYANSAGNRSIELYDKNYNLLKTSTISIPAGESRITLDFEILPGDNYLLAAGSSADLFYNTGSVGYPYAINELVSILKSSYNPDPLGTYYFFYDWEVESMACKSPRVKVSASVGPPVADFTYDLIDPYVEFKDVSIGGVYRYWDFGTGEGADCENPYYLFPTNGSHQIELSVWNACGSDSKTVSINVNLATGTENRDTHREIAVYPIPAEDVLFVEYPVADGILQLFTITGQLLSSEKLNSLGRTSINTSALKSGIYLLRLVTDQKEYTYKVVVRE